jgi:hypothetical protein
MHLTLPASWFARAPREASSSPSSSRVKMTHSYVKDCGCAYVLRNGIYHYIDTCKRHTH